MPKPTRPRLQGTKPPASFEDCIGVKVNIPDYDTPTHGGQPILQTHPRYYLPDTQWVADELRQHGENRRASKPAPKDKMRAYNAEIARLRKQGGRA